METAAAAALQPGNCKPPSGRRMKARAPPPPNQTPATCTVNNEHKLPTDLGALPDQGMINMKENLINRTVDFIVVFPDGEEQKTTVHGSKAVMDLLVDLCSRYHLNPAYHTLELQSSGTQQTLSYKPNTLIGALDVWKILLKEKVPEGKAKRPPPPKIPEKTVRLVVNYLKTQKAVVRVSPEVPLQSIIPVICEKCEVSQECLVLLRDTFTGEELELTKSLNELGIKELYAWDRKRVLSSKAQSEPSLNNRETRRYSTSCDTTEKEKKRFLGFFKTNKMNIKAEECSMRTAGDYGSEEPLKSTTESEPYLDGVATAPYSSSVDSRSFTLGPSQSLGNISGITGSTEMKKRRAPPPPVGIPQMQGGETSSPEKTPSQISPSESQNDLQKKKRRAPPPPTPPIQNRTEEMEDKRKSTVGNLHLSRDISSMEDVALELSETEDTISVSSCFTSEDTTEDSGVMSSPSDVVSLESQNDSMRSRDKSIGAQETLTEMDSMYVEQTCSVRNAFSSSDESGIVSQSSRDEDEMMEAKFENADVFIATQALAALDKDLMAMENMQDDSESGSVSSEMNGSPLPFSRDAETAQDVPVPVPVTIIDEIPETDIIIHPTREEGEPLFSESGANEHISADPISLGKLTNENNNAGSLSKGSVDGISSNLSKSLLQQQSPKEEFGRQTEKEQIYISEAHTPSCEKTNMKDVSLEILTKDGTESERSKVVSSNFTVMSERNRTKEKVKQLKEDNTKEGLPSKIKSELEFRYASTKDPDEQQSISTPSLWCYRVRNGITNYEPKIGLTTFKVVPPKPEAKYFDRDASLSTGAIKIDELGNMVAPNAGIIKKVTVNTTSSEPEETLIGRAKAYWRSNSLKTPLGESPVGFPTKPAVITNFKPLSKIGETKPDSLASLKAATAPLAGSRTVDNNVGPCGGKPLTYATQSSVKMLTTPVVKTDKMELPFQKPQRRTSSHYVASAIAKCIDPLQFKTNQERHDKVEEMRDGEVGKTETEPLPKRCIILAKTCPVEMQPAETKKSYVDIFSCSQNASNTLPLGAHSKIRNSTHCYREPFTTIPSKDGGLTGEKPRWGSIENVVVRETPSIFNQRREQTDEAHCPFFLRSSNNFSSSITSSSSVKSAEGHPINSRPSELDGTTVVNHVVSEKDEKLGSACGSKRVESDVGGDDKVFGPKKKFKPVVQKPLPKDTSLHSALMEAIQKAGGRENLRKISPSMANGPQKKPLIEEQENERSALLAAIRGHSGASKLRKISSSASEELQSFQKAEAALQNREASTKEQRGNQLLLPPPPPPPPQVTMKTPRCIASPRTDSPGDARQALMEAIRSGTGAARLRKVPLLV
ncbi:protein cordon-bleu isoform X5 [Podarcis raffonei]|uniref:protein cordon-bleu isoform X5 n=1 Tax=Podarcis raffonei TaxID=65483 RepID=UPI0023294460|nr:protein cordon-bleu isoform X5 [Podarcis raffonei]